MNLLELRNLRVRYGSFIAVEGVNLALPRGQTLGLVGESGSGKSTVARAIVGLAQVAGGDVLLGGNDVTQARGALRRQARAQVQMVFQDPYAALNPRMSVGETLDEVLRFARGLPRAERPAEIRRLLELVSLDPTVTDRYPHQFSGGQRQRIVIARALAVQPQVLILDEVTSALDVSVQANILNLLRSLQQQLGLTYLFISHNLSVVRYMSDQVAVMYLGRIVECAETETLFRRPGHPYTQMLLSSIPSLAPGAGDRLAAVAAASFGDSAGGVRLAGDIPDPRHPPSGCRFRTRCPCGPLSRAERSICQEQEPPPVSLRDGQQVGCHFPLQSSEDGGGRS